MAGFNREQLLVLMRLGLSNQQVAALMRVLPVVEELLRSDPTATALRKLGTELAGALATVERIVEAMEERSDPAARELAKRVDLEVGGHEATEETNLLVDVMLLRGAVDAAIEKMPRQKRGWKVKSTFPLKEIRRALDEGEAAAEAHGERPVHIPTGGPGTTFATIVVACYTAAVGRGSEPSVALREFARDPPTL